MTPWPAVVPLPYSFVWFEPAAAHVHLSVSWLGFTPGLLEVFGVPEQFANFEPADAPALADTEAEPDAEVLLEPCSSPLPWSWVFADTDPDAELLDWAPTAACSSLLPLPLSSLFTDPEADPEVEVEADPSA